jgi:hypothetical protein
MIPPIVFFVYQESDKRTMQKNALTKFHVEFRKWVLAYKSVKNVNCDPMEMPSLSNDTEFFLKVSHSISASISGFLRHSAQVDHTIEPSPHITN